MSFQTGLSGLSVTSKNLEVIGNNIANANTYGAKMARAEFSDMYASALNGASGYSIGIGVQLAEVSQQFTQGTLTSTDNALDLAINGGGFFQLDDNRGQVVYSRNGQFKLDKEGYVVNNDGMKLMGYQADELGVIQPGVALPMKLPTAGVDPRTTDQIALELNLDSRAEPTDPGAASSPRIRFNDATTYNNATSQTAYDDLGQPVALTYYFQRVDNSADPTASQSVWNMYVTSNGSTLAGTNDAPTPYRTLDFGSDGTSLQIYKPDGTAEVDVTQFSMDLPASVNADGTQTHAIGGILFNFEGSTQYGVDFGVTNMTQRGYPPGSLTGIVLDDAGVAMARYSNGQSKAIGQVELVNFRNVQGLEPVGGNNWRYTNESGRPIPGTPGTGNMGLLQAGSLEESNVDLTSELVNMITAQRNYQANAQTIKTMDQVMQTLVNLR